MTAERLRKLRNENPFQPFCIWMSDGQNFEVTEPEHLAISPRDDTVLVVVAVGDFNILEIAQMKEVIVGTAAATTSI